MLSDSKTNYNMIVIKQYDTGNKKRCIDQSPEINTYINGQLIFQQECSDNSICKNSHFSEWAEQLKTYMKKNKLNLYIHDI